jgi:glutaryl-CoA dehydrogenase
MRGPLSCLNEARFGILWGVVGAARTCYETALEYSRTRHQFGKPIGAFQLTQEKLVNMLLELNKAALVAHHLGRMKDEGRITPQHVSFGKAQQCARRAGHLPLGAHHPGSQRHHARVPRNPPCNNLESVLTYEGTSEIHTLVLGQAITGLAAYS